MLFQKRKEKLVASQGNSETLASKKLDTCFLHHFNKGGSWWYRDLSYRDRMRFNQISAPWYELVSIT